MKSFYIITLLAAFLQVTAYSQQEEREVQLERVFRVMILSPALEYEFPASKKSVLALSAGARPGTPHLNLQTDAPWSTNFHITTFVEAHYKHFYNLEKRRLKGKNTRKNSGNFLSLRLLARGPSIAEFSEYRLRKAEYDFMISPTWGLQRSWSWFYLLFEIGPQVYWDVKGNFGLSFSDEILSLFGFFPQFKVGINLF